MSPAAQVTFSCLLSFGVLLIVLLRELWVLRRYRGNNDGDPRRAPDPQPRPLPPCLVPNEHWRAPTRVRELA